MISNVITFNFHKKVDLMRKMFFYQSLLFILLVGSMAGCGGSGSSSPSSPSSSTPVPPAWGTATLIGVDNTGGALNPQIAMDASGNALAVWEQSDGAVTPVYSIMANSYSAATGLWGLATLIENNTGDTFNPQIAMDASGNALAVWGQWDGNISNVMSNHYSAATGLWGTATLIGAINTLEIFTPQIAIDASGNALTPWEQYDGSVSNIMSNHYSALTEAWGTASLIEENVGDVLAPQIAMDAAGNATAVWMQWWGGGASDIIANHYTAATGLWGTAEPIETDNTRNAFNPQIAMDAAGNALALWYQDDGTVYNIMSNHYSATTGLWGAAEVIENNAENAFTPQIAMDANGNALALWEQSDGAVTPVYSIMSNRYSVLTGRWGTAALIEGNTGDALAPQIAMDAAGNALALWRQKDNTSFKIMSNHYSAGTGLWDTAALIEDNAEDARAPQIAMDASGNAVAVWLKSNGTRKNIWSNTYKYL